MVKQIDREKLSGWLRERAGRASGSALVGAVYEGLLGRVERGEFDVEGVDVPRHHFAPYGATAAACGEPVPKGIGWSRIIGDYPLAASFTTRRIMVTCEACRAELGISEPRELEEFEAEREEQS